MNAWQEEIYEAETAKLWEDLNEPDPDEERIERAKKDIKEAIKHLRDAADWLGEAADDVEGLPFENRILSFLDQLERETFEIQYGLKA